MAIGKHSDFVLYDSHVQTGFNETLKQMTDAFNAASLGAISMQTALHEGNYRREAYFEAVPTLVTRRDLTADPATPITDLALTEDENIRVKLFRKIGPIANTRGSFRTIMQDPGIFSVLIGQQAAKATVIDQLNTGLKACVAALGGVSALVHNVTAASPTDTVSTDNLIQLLAKAGDAQNEIILWVCHSTAYFKLVREQVSTYSFDSVAGFNIARAQPVTLGRPVLMTDSPALHSNLSPTDPVKILGLRRGAIQIEESELQDMVIADVTGGAQLAVRVQGEYAYSLGVLGFKWDMTTGGANPLDTAIATAANWDQTYTSTKSLAGVLMIADPT